MLCKNAVVIVGAYGELGKMVAKDLAKRGMSLILIDKDDDVVKSEDINRNILTYSLDAGNEDQLVRVIDSGSKKLGKSIGYLVYCAGGMSYGSILEEPKEKYMDTFRQNVINPIIATKCVLPYMIKNKFGRILYISSVFSEITKRNFSAYCVSKSGLKTFMESVVKEYCEANISANCVAPGLMKTKFTKAFLKSMMADQSLIDSYMALHRPITKVKEVVSMCTKILLDYEGINGQTIVIDNGYSKAI